MRVYSIASVARALVNVFTRLAKSQGLDLPASVAPAREGIRGGRVGLIVDAFATRIAMLGVLIVTRIDLLAGLARVVRAFIPGRARALVRAFAHVLTGSVRILNLAGGRSRQGAVVNVYASLASTMTHFLGLVAAVARALKGFRAHVRGRVVQALAVGLAQRRVVVAGVDGFAGVAFFVDALKTNRARALEVASAVALRARGTVIGQAAAQGKTAVCTFIIVHANFATLTTNGTGRHKLAVEAFRAFAPEAGRKGFLGLIVLANAVHAKVVHSM